MRRAKRERVRRAAKPARIFTADGRISGYELEDGTVVGRDLGRDCCEAPWECHKPGCWIPLAKPWGMGP